MAEDKHEHGDGKPTDNIDAVAVAQKVMVPALGAGAVGVLGAVGLGAAIGWQHFFHSYLTAYVWVLSLAVGALWWVTLQHLVDAKWCIVLRRTMECFAMTMPVMGVLALPLIIPIFMGNDALYPWAQDAYLQSNAAMIQKAAWFNKGFFAARMVLYFGFWSWLAFHWYSTSVKTDAMKDADAVEKKVNGMRQLAAPTMIGMAATITFASIDFIMTVDPMWFSTIFGVYYFAGCVLGVHSFLALTMMFLQSQGVVTKSVTVHHFHDLGKMMFAFTVFWAYIGFSQFMLIWYANIPEETLWYRIRMGIVSGGAGEAKELVFNGWVYLALFLLFGHFFLPFLGLVSRRFKRYKPTLAFWAVWLLAVHYIDQFWLIQPQLVERGGQLSAGGYVMDALAALGMLALFVGTAAYWMVAAKKIVPVNDPRLAYSMAFENL